MARKAFTAVIGLALIGVGWVAAMISQATSPDFESVDGLVARIAETCR
jgi:hypothetical protein